MAIQDYISDNHKEETKEQAKETSPAQDLGSELVLSRIKVIGVGNAGCNCVRRLMQTSVPSMTFAMVNTDDNILGTNDPRVDVIPISEAKARAWESGGDQRFGDTEDLSDASSENLRQFISGSDLVIVTAGLGGGTGTGAVPYVASLAKKRGALVLGLVTEPFSFEGRRRMGLAVAGTDRLRPMVDNLILIHNDRLLNFVNRDSEMVKAFRTADEVVTQGIIGISEMLNVSQQMNVSLSDMQSMMNHRGGSFMAVGRGAGSNGLVGSAMQAVANPLLDLSIEHAAKVLILLKGGTAAMTARGIDAAKQVVSDAAHNAEKIMIGVGVDESMGENVHLTLIATGLYQEIKQNHQSENAKLPIGENGTVGNTSPVGSFK